MAIDGQIKYKSFPHIVSLIYKLACQYHIALLKKKKKW